MASNDIPVTINGHTVVGTAKIYLDSDRSGMAIVTIDRGAAFLEELMMSNLTGMSFTSPHGEINEAVDELLEKHPIKDLSSRIEPVELTSTMDQGLMDILFGEEPK